MLYQLSYLGTVASIGAFPVGREGDLADAVPGINPGKASFLIDFDFIVVDTKRRYAVAALKPVSKVHIRASTRTEGPIFRVGRPAADGADAHMCRLQ
ncbi:hypothetical protein AA101099_2379 [Neoasaia chiangmaiensis NBRC 101099]|nr:hypothetical protein AA101099_2379 [Neoasaia chiangmaiensis NBRC 101099]GEN13632.1 hypothetical protein NCH01_00630 [Neoasaia chiangmaiensis]